MTEQDQLRSLSREEFERLPRLSREEIEELLARGRADRRAAERAMRPSSVDPSIRFRSA